MLTRTAPRRVRLRLPALAASALLWSFISATNARALIPAPLVTGTALGVSSITWTWPSDGTATGYRVLSTTSPGANISGDMAALPSGSTNAFILTGLSTNTFMSVVVEAYNGAATADAPASNVLTLAAVPSGTMLLSSNNNQVTLSWVTDGNPTGPGQVTYQVNWTTAAGIGILFSTNPSVNVVNDSATATVGALPGGMTINFDVQALNSSGVPSGFDVTVTTTIPYLQNQSIISSATFADGISSITWYWSASTGAIAYQLFSATNGAVSPVLSSSTLVYTQTGLLPNTNYTDYVYAYSVPTSTSSAPYALYTLAAPTTHLMLLGLSLPPAVQTPTESISWGANGNPAFTSYNVLWWTDLTSTITFSTGTTSALVPGLYGGSTVYFTVQSYNNNGSTAAYDDTYFATIPSTTFATAAQILPVGYAGIVTFVVPSPNGGLGVLSAQISSGTFAVPVTINVSTPAVGSGFPAVGGAVSDLPIPIHLTISALDTLGNPQQPSQAILLTLNYTILNSAANGTTLSIARFDATHGVWMPLATTKQAGGGLAAVTDHLSSFAVVSVAAAGDLSSITVGPNPLRPIVNPGSVMTFRNLPAGCRVRIFSYIGEKIVDMVADGGGVVAWNGRNHVGSFVASGIYIVLIEGGGTKKKMRVAIER